MFTPDQFESYKNTFVNDSRRVREAVKYDRIDVAANVAFGTDKTFFISPQSDSKTELMTNMEDAGKLQPGFDLLVKKLCVHFNEDIALADLMNLRQNYYARLYITNTVWFQAPLWKFTAGGGVYGATTKSDQEVWNTGVPDVDNAVRFDTPLLIASGQAFKFQVTGTSFTTLSTGNGVQMTVTLDGVEYGLIS